jgi:histidine triad (HIT) family protein
MPTIFAQIISRELPAKIFHETDDVIVIADHRPRAPVHLLIIPKTESTDFYETPYETLTMLNRTAKMIAEKLGIIDHFQILINNGLGQEVPHLHYHFMSDRGADKLTFVQT